jgi:hypothetical protein
MRRLYTHARPPAVSPCSLAPSICFCTHTHARCVYEYHPTGLSLHQLICTHVAYNHKSPDGPCSSPSPIAPSFHALLTPADYALLRVHSQLEREAQAPPGRDPAADRRSRPLRRRVARRRGHGPPRRPRLAGSRAAGGRAGPGPAAAGG